MTFETVKIGTDKYTEVLADSQVKEVGVNGVANEDLTAMVMQSLKQLQDSDYACKEDALDSLSLRRGIERRIY